MSVIPNQVEFSGKTLLAKTKPGHKRRDWWIFWDCSTQVLLYPVDRHAGRKVMDSGWRCRNNAEHSGHGED